MGPRPNRCSKPTAAEADAWAEVLVRCGLLHAAVRVPNGQWLIQHRADSPVHVLTGPADIVELAATIQHRIRSARPRTR